MLCMGALPSLENGSGELSQDMKLSMDLPATSWLRLSLPNIDN